ncbi:MAG TPA: thiamine pyrophosphate-dependent enzyme [Galbitalea sp.]|nr:thiamine pyrophosphate-dependent enzyme [Galbitalea sp.]
MSQVPTRLPEQPSIVLARGLYERMVLARELDTEAVTMQRQGILPGHAPTRGQEAAQVGSASALDLTRDFAFPTYRELAVAVAMGVDLVAYMATHLGTWNGGTYNPVLSRLAPVNAVVGAPVLHAVGWAMGEQRHKRDGVSLAYFGDGASSQGDIHEAMNFAGVYGAPVVFFCQSNGWAISLPTKKQVAGGSIAARAAGYGMPGVAVDGNDVNEVYRATAEAVERARSGDGPSVIEAITYRMGPHSTSDDPGRYRTLEEERDWQARDPLLVAERELRDAREADDDYIVRVLADARSRVEEIREGILGLEARPGEEMFDFLFERTTDALRRQRSEWKASVQ